MPRLWWLTCLPITGYVLTGCASPQPDLRPVVEERFVTPPDDPRFSQPIRYPDMPDPLKVPSLGAAANLPSMRGTPGAGGGNPGMMMPQQGPMPGGRPY